MAPESNTPENAQRTAPSGQTVTVPAPADGAAVTVVSSPGGELDLGFDPGTATATRSDNSLVFELDSGGTVTITDFFVVGDESLPSLKLPDGTVVASADFFEGSDLDMTTAAGPGAGTAPGSGTNYDDDPGALLAGLDKYGKLGTDYWGRETEYGDEYQNDLWPSLDFGLDTMLLGIQNVNESDQGTSLNISFSFAPQGEVVLYFRVGGSGQTENSTYEEFESDFWIDTTGGPGYTVTFDPDTGLLTVTVNGATDISIPVNLVDDHINDNPKDVVFTLEDYTGNILASTGSSVTLNISEDYDYSHEHAGEHETGVYDGPIVGLHNITELEGEHANLGIYEGSPNGNTFTFGFTFTDPHTGDAYQGFESRHGGFSGVLSQDMVIMLNPAAGGDARHSFDYHLVPSEELAALKEAGMVDYKLNDDGTFELVNGMVQITVHGRVDVDGNRYPADGDVKAFDLDRVGEITIEAKVLVNSEGGSAAEGDEDFSLAIAGVQGNEGQRADQEPARAEIAKDPVLSLNEIDDVQESQTALIPLVLNFDKPIGDDVEFRAEINIGGNATLWLGSDLDKFRADYMLDGLNDVPADWTVAAGSSATSIIYNDADGNEVLRLEIVGGQLIVTGKGSVLDGDNDLTVNFKLNDDHIGGTEKTGDYDEDITFQIDQVTLNDGYSGHGGSLAHPDAEHTTDGGVGWENGAKTVDITDDYENEDVQLLDGPVVSVTLEPTSTSEAAENATLNFIINLTDPHNGLPYTDYYGDGVLSQDMTIILNVTNDGATYGTDYNFAEAVAALDAMLGVSAKYENGVITITLDGKVNGDGIPKSGPYFTVPADGKLALTADIINDTVTEREAEHITVEVGSVSGNESAKKGTGITGTIEPDKEEEFNGPVIALMPKESVTESGTPDPADKVTHNTVTHSIVLDKAPTEAIEIVVSLDGKDGANRYTGTTVAGAESPNSSDFAFGKIDDGAFVPNLVIHGGDRDGQSMVQADSLADFRNGEGDFFYDATTGEIHMRVPEGATSVDFDVTVIDDMRETSESGESYDVSLELVYKDAEGNRYEADDPDKHADALPDGEASLGKVTGMDGDDPVIAKEPVGTPSVTESTDIVDDARNGELNPALFDGPYVFLSTENAGLIYESAAGDPEGRPTSIEYQLDFKDPDGLGGTFTSAEETIVVELTFTALSPTFEFQYNGDFRLGDIKFNVKDGVLYDANDKALCNVSDIVLGDDGNGNATMTIKVPFSAEEINSGNPPSVKFDVNDDPLRGPLNDDVDNESFKVQITGVEGNEARVTEAGAAPIQTTVVDDNADSIYEGVHVGLSWIVGPNSAGNLVESHDYKAAIKLYDANGKAIGYDADAVNPYGPYSDAAGTIPDNLTIKMTLGATNGADAADYTFGLGKIGNLLGTGKITLFLDDTGLTYSMNGTGNNDSYQDLLNYLTEHPDALRGQVTVTLVAGQFSMNEHADDLQFDILVHGDNVNEYDQKWKYHDGEEAANKAAEKVAMEITEVDGNESQIKTDPDSTTSKLESHITDSADGKVSLGVDTVSGGWEFTASVTYTDNETNAVNQPVTVPGEAVHLQVKVTDSDVMHRGEEYNVSAYELFLSINQNEGNSFAKLPEGVVDAASYNDWIAGFVDNAALLQACEQLGLTLVRESGSYEKAGASNDYAKGESVFDVYAPKDDMADGKIQFEVGKGSSGVGGAHDGFTVEVVDPYNGDPDSTPSYDIKGEIVKVDEDPVEAEVGEKLYVSMEGKHIIHEEPKAPGTTNVDHYRVNFHADRDGNDVIDEAAANVTFRLTLSAQGFGRKAELDTDTTDNHLPSQVKDYAFCDESGNELIYSGTGANSPAYPGLPTDAYDVVDGKIVFNDNPTTPMTLLQALNLDLFNRYGGTIDEDGTIHANVKITSMSQSGIGTDARYSFDFDVKEGTDLSEGIGLDIKALDDGISDSGEGLKMEVSGVGSYLENNPDVSNPVDFELVKNKQETEIRDETPRNPGDPGTPGNPGDPGTPTDPNAPQGTLNGFAIGIVNGKGWETVPNYPQANFETDREGSISENDTAVIFPVRAYILDDDGNVLTIDALTALYNATDTNLSLNDFIGQYFRPIQDTYIRVGTSTGSAEEREDFKSMHEDIKLDGGDAWTLKFDENGDPYFEQHIRVETIDDFINEIDEKFTITIEEVYNSYGTGNESRPIRTDEGDGDAKTTATGTIVEVLDGPVLVEFGPSSGTDVYEPIDRKHPENDKEGTDPDRLTQYTVRVEPVTSEAVAVWFSVKGGKGAATFGEDYTFGEGAFYYDGATVYAYNNNGVAVDTGKSLGDFWQATYGEALPTYVQAQGGGYFTVIEKGHGAADFNVITLDDNKDESETIHLVIEDMQGSEVRYLDENGEPKPWDYKNENDADFTPNAANSNAGLLDDGFGPTAGIENGENGLSIVLEGKCQQDVVVTVKVINSSNGEITTIKVTIDEGATEANFQSAVDAALSEKGYTGSYFVVIEGKPVGGEAHGDGTPTYVYKGGSGGTGWHVDLEDFQSRDAIHEGQLPKQPGPDSAAYEVKLDFHHPEGSTPGGFTFDLNFYDGTADQSDLLEGTYSTVKVTVSAEDAEAMADAQAAAEAAGNNGAKVVMVIEEGGLRYEVVDADGKPIEGYGGPINTNESGITGNLPTAVGDSKLEGTEDFHAIITSPSGVDVHDAVATTDIIDETNVGVVLLVDDGTGKLVPLDQVERPEGTQFDIIVKLVLVDGDGNPITGTGEAVTDWGKVTYDDQGNATYDWSESDLETVSTDMPLDFNVSYPGANAADLPDGKAAYNEDFTGPNNVRLDGDNYGKITIHINEDNYSEGVDNNGREDFTVEVSLDPNNAFYPEVKDSFHKDPDTGTIGSGGTVIITDNNSGPTIEWGLDRQFVGEHEGITLTIDSYKDGIRTVVDENVNITFNLTPKAVPGQPGEFNLDDIQSVTVNDTTYTYNGAPGSNLTDIFKPDGNGGWNFTVRLDGGKALDKVSIQFRDDTKYEGDEMFTLKVVDVVGGEVSINPAVDVPVDVTVRDHPNGPTLNIEAGTASEETLTATVTVTIKGNETEEDSSITLKLDNKALARFDFDPDADDALDTLTGMLSGITGAKVTAYDKDTGEITISLPEGVGGSNNSLTITFPIKDDSLVNNAEDTFGVSLTGVSNEGELQMAGVPKYSSEWAGERGGVGTTDGGSNTLLFKAGGPVGNVSGDAVLELTGIGNEEIVKDVFVNGVKINASDMEWQGGKLVVHTPGLSGEYKVEVVYKHPGSDQAAKDAIEDAKQNIGGSGRIENSNLTANMPITDESTEAKLDGPIASLVINNDASIVEGADYNGTDSHAAILVVQMPNLPGDAAVTAEDLIITLNVSREGGGITGFEVAEGFTISGPNAQGVVTITIPKGTDIVDGTIRVGFTPEVRDDNLGNNPDVVIELENIRGGATGTEDRYETYSKTDDESGLGGNVAVEDGTALSAAIASLHFTATEAHEGVPTQLGNIVIDLPGTGKAEAAMQITLEVPAGYDSITVGGVTYTVNSENDPISGGGTITITIPKNAGSNGTVSLPVTVTATDDVFASQPVDGEFRITGFTQGTTARPYEDHLVGNAAATVTITDEAIGDGFQLSLHAAPSIADPSYVSYAVAINHHGDLTIADQAPATTFVIAGLGSLADSVLAQLQADAGYEALGITFALGNGGIVVTLPEGYNYDDASSIGFDLHASEAYGTNISITDVDGGNLEYADVNPAASQHAVDAAYGEDYFDASASTHGVVIYGDGETTSIIGSDQGDIIHSGSTLGGETVTVTAGDGDDVIYAGSGNDILVGGLGDDTFIWSSESFGGHDTIVDFEFDHETFHTTPDVGDRIDLGNLFGGVENIGQIIGNVQGEEGDALRFSYSKEDSSGESFEAYFKTPTELELTLKSGGTEQIITINAAEGDAFYGSDSSLDASQAQEILSHIIKGVTGTE